MDTVNPRCDEPHLYRRVGEASFPPEELSIPLVEVSLDDIDKIRTYDFTSPDADQNRFKLLPLDLGQLESGRLRHLLIEAPAGFGKSFVLERTAEKLGKIGPTFLVTCDKLTGATFDAEADQLLYQVVCQAIDEEAAQRFKLCQGCGCTRFLIIDALNEIGVGQGKIIRLLELAAGAENLIVLASQRPANPYAPPKEYTYGFLLPFRKEDVEERVGSVELESVPLLRIPFFFEMRQRKGIQAPTRVEVINKYFEQCVDQLMGEEFHKLLPGYQKTRLAEYFQSIGEAAQAVYCKQKSTSASKSFFSSNGLFSGIGGLEKALQAGFLVMDGDMVRFRHQLFHDWAIAWYYRQTKMLLGVRSRKELEVATLSRQSTDALEFLVQMQAEESIADAEQTVLRIYDWDYPAAAASLVSWLKAAFGPDSHIKPPPVHLQIAIFALIAAKQFDSFEHTVLRFQALKPWVDPKLRELMPRHLSRANYSFSQLIEAVKEINPEDHAPVWYRLWVSAFGGMDLDALLKLVESGKAGAPGEEILGWTAANTLARSALNEAECSQIQEFFNKSKALTVQGNDGPMQDHAITTCWRLVHAVSASPMALQFLYGAAEDQELASDVRYGAVRSLCSIALTKDRDTAHAAIEAIHSLDEAGALNDGDVAPVILRCCIPAPGLVPRDFNHWTKAFTAMLQRHAEGLADTDHVEAATWRRRIAEFDVWKSRISS